MIIQLRGTSGSGKSHIMRSVLGQLRNKTKWYEPGRKQPLGYGGWFDNRHIAIPGHYETPCGGCDTIPDLTKVFDTVLNAVAGSPIVLFEGLLASEDTRRTLELRDTIAPELFRVINIITPIEDCLAGIQQRRDARGDVRPLKPDNTVNRVRTINRACAKLRDAGMEVYEADRERASQLVFTWLWETQK